MDSAVIVTHSPQGAPIDKAVIWLHGLGANGHDFVPVVPELGLQPSLGVRFIFPHAPQMPVTINGGYVMPAWYDIFEMGDLSRRVDEAQIKASSARIHAIIDRQLAEGIKLADIVIAGFSQGGAVAYHAALTRRGLGGLLALSSYFATAEMLDECDIQADRSLPICIHHGSYDDVVSPNLGGAAKQMLTTLGFASTFQLYPMAHQVCTQQIQDIGNWLNGIFAAMH